MTDTAPATDVTEPLHRDDGYLRECAARVIAVDGSLVRTDRTVFYARGGGQPGDTGRIVRLSDGDAFDVVDARPEGGAHAHVLGEGHGLAVGDEVRLELDWERRHRIMRHHGALHMLCAAVPAAVTSGSIRTDQARLDFDLPEPVDRDEITEALNALVERDAPMTTRRIPDAELDAHPELVRTRAVRPPRDPSGTVRLVEYEGIDLQPCGGTHVASSGEIGRLRVRKIEKKGRANRRIILVLES